MYNKYYGFSTNPFELSPDPEVVYMSEAHQEALAILRYGVVGKKGFLVLTGDVEQIDNPYIDASSNGLSVVIEAFKESKLAANIIMEKGERSPLSEEATIRL